MKIILLMTGCLTVLSLIATAQLRPDANQSAYVSLPATEPTAPAQSGNEYASLNNTPYFPGGQQALQAYFGNPALYPDEARISTANGTLKVQFRVMPDGQLSELRIVQSGGLVLDRAVLAAVSVMPRWYPAHREGVAVPSLYLLPVRFTATEQLSGNKRFDRLTTF